MTPDATREQTEVVGRGGELSRIDDFLDRLVEGPAALVLEGESGIGKTTLWQHGVSIARKRGWRILAVRPAESEARLSFAGLADLLDGVDDAFVALPDPQLRALEVALLRAEPTGSPPEPRAVFAAVLEVLRAVSAHGPVLLALDDAQWLDRSTRDALEFAIHRFADEPIGPLIAVRNGSTLPLGVSRSFPEERVTRLQVEPLAPDEMRDLLRVRLDTTFPPPAFSRLYEMSGGNPFFALEIARATLRGDERATGLALPVPRSLREDLVRDRVGALPSLVREMLLFAAAASRPTVALMEAALDRSPLESQLEKASSAGIVRLTDGAISFTHPLYRSAIYDEGSRQHRHRVHRRLAEVISDAEERARHLALAAEGPDEQVANELESAAAIADARGATIAAGDLYELAIQLTPLDEQDALRQRRLAAADRWFLAGDPERATRLLEQVRASTPRGVDRAGALWRLARLCHHEEVGRAAQLSVEALEQEGLTARLRAEILTQLAWVLTGTGDLAEAGSRAYEAITEAEEAGDPELQAEALYAYATVLGWQGDARSSEVFRRATEVASSSGPPTTYLDPGWTTLNPLLQAGELDEARKVLSSSLTASAERGDEFSVIDGLSILSDIEDRQGDWGSALAHLAEAERLAPDSLVLLSVRALVEAHLGDVDRATADAERSLERAESSNFRYVLIDSLRALGHVRLALGDAEQASAHLLRAWEDLRRAGFGDPLTFPFVPDLIEALVELGRLEEAEPIVDWLEERGRTLDRAYALATGARCRGLFLAARGDIVGGISAVEGALKHHERVPMPFELARTYLVLGAIRRRDKQKRSAREALEHALEIFEELGARLWVERTSTELARIGGRRAVVGELTEAERRVANLAAAGRTNREIADTLFMSVRTVEGHLSHAYAKLGIRSRTELALFVDEAERSPHS